MEVGGASSPAGGIEEGGDGEPIGAGGRGGSNPGSVPSSWATPAPERGALEATSRLTNPTRQRTTIALLAVMNSVYRANNGQFKPPEIERGAPGFAARKRFVGIFSGILAAKRARALWVARDFATTHTSGTALRICTPSRLRKACDAGCR